MRRCRGARPSALTRPARAISASALTQVLTQVLRKPKNCRLPVGLLSPCLAASPLARFLLVRAAATTREQILLGGYLTAQNPCSHCTVRTCKVHVCICFT